MLVVDDDAASRDLLTTNLRREGYRTVQARGGDEALELALKLRPDAITLDVLMPKTDGWAVLAALKPTLNFAISRLSWSRSHRIGALVSRSARPKS